MGFERVDQIRRQRDGGGEEAEAKGGGADHGDDVEDLVLGGPAVEEEADGDEDAAEDHGGEAVFGFQGGAWVERLLLLDVPV